MVFTATAESLELTTENVEAVLDEVMTAKQLLTIKNDKLGQILLNTNGPECMPINRSLVLLLADTAVSHIRWW